MTEDKMVGWHHRLDGHEFEQAQGLLINVPWSQEFSDVLRTWT